MCCGSAGTYNILHQKMAKSLLKNKVENIEKISPDFISTGNIGCMTQIASGTKIPIVHTVEVIDWLTGGPKPIKLKNFNNEKNFVTRKLLKENEDKLRELFEVKLNLMIKFILLKK